MYPPTAQPPAENDATRAHATQQEIAKYAMDLVRRLDNLHNHLFGPEPKAAAGQANTPDPTGFFPAIHQEASRTIDALNVAGSILGTIEQRLGQNS